MLRPLPHPPRKTLKTMNVIVECSKVVDCGFRTDRYKVGTDTLPAELPEYVHTIEVYFDSIAEQEIFCNGIPSKVNPLHWYTQYGGALPYKKSLAIKTHGAYRSTPNGTNKTGMKRLNLFWGHLHEFAKKALQEAY